MERRLAEYRAARRATGNATPSTKSSAKAAAPAAAMAAAETPEQPPPRPEESVQRTASPKAETSVLWWTNYFLMNVTFLKFLLWLVLLGLFVELEFGLVYFVLSMFYWIYVGTRGPGERQTGEKSAYSVFNPGCEAIEGTLTAEQFERELLYQPLVLM
uniref:SAYSvFN domain-containing protein 1 n=1 Tax=Pogona vitticeps TaxID=103695 RepID=A0A6J0SWI7_9SAUR